MSEQKRGKDWNRGTRGRGGKRRKDLRREAAFARDAASSKMSLEQKLAGLPPEGANRQRARYAAQIAKRKAENAEKAKTKPAEKNREKIKS